VYGLPEWNFSQIKSAALIANPGCYPTSAILPLAPLLKEGVIKPKGIAVSSLSGVSGAGKSTSVDMSFAEVNESVRAYKVGVHQHLPEIRTILKMLSGVPPSLSFVPHLLPITRGIYTTIYATLLKQLDDQAILAIYEKYYGKAPFVRISASAIPEIKNVNYTNFIDIGFRVNQEDGQIVVLSAIDNLIKGAAGQAVQNMNIMFGFGETEGLK
jgi:N-acetyl-gamma-glutamyl-phosphate reductase